MTFPSHTIMTFPSHSVVVHPLLDRDQDDDLEGDEDHLLEEDSPDSGNDYLSLSHHGVSLSDIPGPTLGMTSMAPPQQLMAGSHY